MHDFAGYNVMGGLWFITNDGWNDWHDVWGRRSSWEPYLCQLLDISMNQMHNPISAYQGFWAETDCCPIVSGIKLRFASGDEQCAGACPDNEAEGVHEGDQLCWGTGCAWVNDSFRYMHTDWKEVPVDLIGFGGSTGAAWDSLFLIFNTCGPKVKL